MQTRAAVAWKAGEPLSIETIDIEGPKAGEVLVEIKASGVCHTDAYTLSGADPATELKKAHEQFRPILERSEKS